MYFYVQRTSNYDSIGSRIPFNVERLNIGGAMDLGKGTFTAPRSGTYFFSVSATVVMPQDEGSGNLHVALFLNDAYIGRANGNSQTGIYMNGDEWETLSLQSTLNLKSGDTVWLQITGKAEACYLRGDYINFTGWLLQEEITPQLNV